MEKPWYIFTWEEFPPPLPGTFLPQYYTNWTSQLVEELHLICPESFFVECPGTWSLT